MATAMDDARPRPRPRTLTEQAPHNRAELVRYYAWGYLSRRELNERLKALDPTLQEAQSAAYA
jgi:hypothetical protein